MNYDKEERALRLFEGQVKQMTEDLDYFAEQLFERPLTTAEQGLVARALEAYMGEYQAVDALRNRIAGLIADQMMKARNL